MLTRRAEAPDAFTRRDGTRLGIAGAILALVLTVFFLIGGSWAYAKVDNVVRSELVSVDAYFTAEERAAAFPDLGDMDMRDHMAEDPMGAVLRVDQLEWNQDDALGWNLRASIGGTFDKMVLRSYDKVKRTFHLNDDFASRLLRLLSRRDKS